MFITRDLKDILHCYGVWFGGEKPSLDNETGLWEQLQSTTVMLLSMYKSFTAEMLEAKTGIVLKPGEIIEVNTLTFTEPVLNNKNENQSKM